MRVMKLRSKEIPLSALGPHANARVTCLVGSQLSVSLIFDTVHACVWCVQVALGIHRRGWWSMTLTMLTRIGWSNTTWVRCEWEGGNEGVDGGTPEVGSAHGIEAWT